LFFVTITAANSLFLFAGRAALVVIPNISSVKLFLQPTYQRPL